MTQRPGYLGPEAEADRNRQLIASRSAAPKRGTVLQDDPATLALFAPTIEPRMI